MPFVFAPPAQAAIPVLDERYEFFPIHRVYGIAKNYAEPGAPKDTPFYFMKTADNVVAVPEGEVLSIPMPPGTNDLRHEIELVACLGRGGRNLTLEEAQEAVWGWSVGIDFTVADQKLPSGGRDMMRSKVFERSAPVSFVKPAYRTPLPNPVDLWLYVNNQKRQAGSTSNLVLSPYEQIVELSRYFTLEPGDIIFTGTPNGSSTLAVGDMIDAGVNGIGSIKVKIVENA